MPDAAELFPPQGCKYCFTVMLIFIIRLPNH